LLCSMKSMPSSHTIHQKQGCDHCHVKLVELVYSTKYIQFYRWIGGAVAIQIISPVSDSVNHIDK
jgi:hypothetical protein